MKSLLLIALALCCGLPLQAADPATFPVGGLTFTRPADWSWVEVASPMRKAQLKVPGASASESAEIAFFHFGAGNGGDVQSNAQRWVGQFHGGAEAAKIEPQEIAGTKVTLVTTEGTFSSGMPGGATTPLENYALLGAIIEGPDGSVFVKMTGPAALIKSTRPKFLGFLATALAKK